MLGPKKITLEDIGLQSFGALIAGFIGSLIILVCIFALSSILDIPGGFSGGGDKNPLFPFALSLLTFFGTIISVYILNFMLSLVDSESYKRNSIISSQLGIFGILVYIGITPVYIFLGMQNYEYIMFVFIIHSLILAFGSILILEILNHIRYILIHFYACFIALGITSIMTLSIFLSFESGFAKLLSLLFLLPAIFGLLVLIKSSLQYLYYHYYLWSGYDPLGDIFVQIERKEQEAVQEATQKNIL